MKKSITIAIPTYNRFNQIINLIKHFIENREIYLANLNFDLLIYDNSTNLELNDFLNNSNLISDHQWINYNKNEKNIGFDLNILKLYSNASSEFVWFFGDDDFPELNCFQHIKEGLSHNPDILLLPFRQPLSLLTPQYQKDEFIETSNISFDNILKITHNSKITSFVVRKINLISDDLIYYDLTGWMHLILAFEILSKSTNNKVISLNKFCARALSDNDIKSMDWVPSAFLNFDKLLSHEYLKKHLKNQKIIDRWNDNYLSGIILTCWGASGAWKVRGVTMLDYINFGKSYPFRNVLFKKPRYFFYWLLLKVKLSKLFISHFIHISKLSGYE
jgi:hypothetical protein